tara:strand:+ start:1432 stop:2106 length:675 start_codon:yes stop_codon:yes gene_type:complete
MKSFIRLTSPEKLIREYNKSFFEKKFEFQKIKWTSKKSMENRYNLLFSILPKKKFLNWIDIGCGTGGAFKYYKKTEYKINKIYGLEINENLYKYTKKKFLKQDIIIENSDVINFNSKNKFELITLIGVLQNCGHNPFDVLKKTSRILKKNGLIFLTTKNVNFKNLTIKNSNQHSWFNPFEIANELKKNSIKIIKMFGFDPHTNTVKNLDQSNTFFILGKKYDKK